MRILSLGIEKYDRNRITGVKSVEMNKPWGGILWGSPLIELPNGQVTSSWNKWVDDDFQDKNFDFGISFELHKNSNIMEIASFDDYIRYMNQYKMLDPQYEKIVTRGYVRYCLDFVKIAEEFDAFHLTEDAFWQLRMPMDSSFHELNYSDFYTYDAESWIIFNPDCINEASIVYHNNIYKKIERRDFCEA